MKAPGLPYNEPDRLRALASYEVVDTAAEHGFDALARLAAHVAGVPIGLVSLVDANRQWFKARYGLDVPETPRQVSFCGHVVESGQPLVVDDARGDDRFADNPLVTDGVKVRFYAGWPLRTPDGFVLGTICAIGREPKTLNDEQRTMLSLLAGQVIDQLEARRNSLAESEVRLRGLFDAMVEGVVVHDVTGAITTVNRAAERILGLSHDQLRGRTSIDPRWRTVHVDGTPFPGADHPAMRALSSGQSQLDVTMGVHKATGELSWISINAIPLMETGATKPSAVAVTFHDISEKRAADLAREQLAQQQRLITTGTLASGVGHEINNPLAYVVANLEVAIEDVRAIEGGSPSGRVKSIVDALGDAREGADRIRRIVRGLRSLAREDTVPLPTNVQQVVATSLDMAMHELRHRASIEVGDFDVPLVSADESRLAQMLVNLLVNAGQAFALADPERNKVSVVADRRGDVVSIAVTDNGPGIAPEVVSRIFDPFFTTKPVGQGTGLGLSICHSIATSLGGTITCKTEVGRGTTFEILLPVAHEAQVPVAPAVLAAKGGGTILALDDEGGVLRSLVRALSIEFEVVTCSDAREAWRRLEGGERFDVIFCDIAMPHLSGFEVLRRLRQLDAEQATRLVFISGGTADGAAFDADEVASVELLEKPFTVQALRGIARRYVSRSRLPV